MRMKIILAFAAIYLVWGSTFFGVSIALKSFPPFLLSAFRFLIGGLLLAGYCFMRKEKLPVASDILKFSLWGVVIFGGGVVAVVWAQQYLPSSLASIIITTPFWFIVLDKSQWHVNFKNAWTISGLIAGLAGVVLLLSQRSLVHFNGITLSQTLSILVIAAGSMLWVIGSLRLRGDRSGVSVYMRTTVHLMGACVFAFAVALLSGELSTFSIQQVRADSVFALVFISVFSTTITFLAFIWLVQVKPVALVSTYSYVNPMIAVLLGVFIGRESISAMQICAMGIILAGVLFISIPKYKLKP